MSESIIDKAGDYIDDLKDVMKERFLSPMYFYFIIAWMITNWRFTYVFFFADETLLGKPKEQYLGDLYSVSHWSGYIWNSAELFIFPAIAAYIAIWWLSKVSERFYERYEQYKINKKVIDRKLIYNAKYQEAQDQKEIREVENDLKSVKYDDNVEFNNYLDSIDERVVVMGYPMQPSRVLYNMDYVAYTDELQAWKEQQLIEDTKERVRDEVIEEYRDDLAAENQQQQEKDNR